MPKMTESELKAHIGKQLKDSKPSQEIQSARELGLKLYRGDSDIPGYEKRSGHSEVISKDVQDTIEWLLPGLMKIFHGMSKVVEFLPQSDKVTPDSLASDTEAARQATDYVDLVYNRDNPGWMITYTLLKDGLLQKVGVVKHWWLVEKKTETEMRDGLTQEEVDELVAPDDIEVLEQREDDGFFSIKTRRKYEKKRIAVECVPLEEFRIASQAKSLADTDFACHLPKASVETWIARGFNREDLKSAPVPENRTKEKRVRFKDEPDPKDDEEEVTLAECYSKVDFDGDGIAEWRKITMTGDDGSGEILDNEEIVDIKDVFSAWSPIPMPHRFWGMSVAETVSDIMLVKTTLKRQILDNLYRTNNPMKKVRIDGLAKGCEGDVLVSRPDGLIRVDDMDAVEAFEVPFTAAASFPMLEAMNREQEGRTGVSGSSTGQDPDILKSHQTKGAVDRVMTTAQERRDLIAFVFANTVFKDMMTAILRLSIRHQDKARMVRLRDEFVQVDTQTWNANMDVTADVGLGTGNKDALKMSISQMITWQKEALQAPGLGLVEPGRIYSALDQYARASGFKSANTFYVDPKSDEGKAIQQKITEQPKPPTETEAFMKVEEMKIQASAQKDQANRQLELLKMRAEDDRERDKAEADIVLRAAELEVKGAKVDLDRINALMQRARDFGSETVQ